MRMIEISKEHMKDEKEKVVAIAANNIDQAKELLQTKRIGPCHVNVIRDERKNTVNGVLFDQENYFKT